MQIVNISDLQVQGHRFEVLALESSRVTISQTMRDRTNITIVSQQEVACLMAYLHLILTRSKGQGQGHIPFYCKYIWNGDIYGSHCYW